MSESPTSAAEGSAAPTRRAAVRDMGVQIVGRALNIALGIVVAALVARTLGSSAYGQWVTLLAVVVIAGELTQLGLTGVAVRQAATDPARETAWVGALVTIKAALALVLTPVAAVVVLLLAETTEMRVAGLVLMVMLVLNIPMGLSAIFQIRMRNGIPVGVMTLNSVLWTAAVIALAAASAGLRAFAIAFVAVAVVTTGVQTVAALRIARMRLRGTRELWAELLRIGVPLSIGSLLILAYARIDQILVFEIAGSREAGLYGAAYRILEQAHFIPLSIMTTLAPMTAASAISDPERVWRIVVLTLRVLLIVSLGGVAMALPLAAPGMALLFGEEFREAGGALAVLAGAFVFICLGYLAGTLVLAYRLERRFVLFAAAGLVVNVALNLLLLPVYGYVAAAWATLITEVVVVVPTLAIAFRRLPRALPVAPYLRSLAAGAVLAALLAGLDAAGVPFGVLLVAAVPLYAGLLLLTGAVERRELRDAGAAVGRKLRRA